MTMKACHLHRLVIFVIALGGSALSAADYKSPYKVEFTFKEEDLIGDLLQGPRGDWKEAASVPYRDWYDAANQKRWRRWGPAAKHFDPPAGIATRSPEWLRQRVIATGLRFVGYTYQHHHVPDWEPPADWPKDEKQTTPVTKGLDCSNFTAFVYNLALGIKPTGDVQDQSALTEAPGPGIGHTTAVRRIELPAKYEDFAATLRTGDLLFVKNNQGEVSHVVLWVGNIGHSPDGVPLILDSTSTGTKDSNGVSIPDGIQLRPFKRGYWYASKASHALRVIPEDK
jgi:cell wall-associated NlpC family hydrolase